MDLSLKIACFSLNVQGSKVNPFEFSGQSGPSSSALWAGAALPRGWDGQTAQEPLCQSGGPCRGRTAAANTLRNQPSGKSDVAEVLGRVVKPCEVIVTGRLLLFVREGG